MMNGSLPAIVGSGVAGTMISIALMLGAGFLMTRLTKLAHLPNVTGYILAGILLGPYVLGLIPPSLVEGMDFLSDIALAFIAFSTGEYFKLAELKKNGLRVVVITVAEAFAASLCVFAVTFWCLKLNLAFSVVLAALAAATAPASTMMTIRQTGAKGDFVNTLLEVVALDDAVGLIEFSIAVSVAGFSLSGGEHLEFSGVLRPLLLNLLTLVLGGLFGFLLKLLITQKRTQDNRLIVTVALLFTFCGISALLDVSPLLGCMVMSAVYINLTDDDKLFMQMNYFSPPILLLFFVRSGLNFKLDALVGASNPVGSVPLLTVSVLYFFVRIAGKYGGAFVGCMAVGKPKKVRNYLGMALVPQAGVAIGLASLGARTLGGAAGEALYTIIMASSVLYELVGPACAKLSLYLSGSYSDKLEELVPEEKLSPESSGRTPVELLIERIRVIQQELPAHEKYYTAEEEAFLEAAEEQQAALYLSRRQRERRIK